MALRPPQAAAPRPNQQRGPVLIGAALVVLLCLGFCAAGLGFRSAAARGRLRAGYVVQVCIGLNTGPRPQLGVTWIAPFMSSLPPLRLSNPACAVVPWLPVLPARGGFAFP